MATSPKPETVDSESVRAVAGFRSRAVALGTVDCSLYNCSSTDEDSNEESDEESDGE